MSNLFVSLMPFSLYMLYWAIPLYCIVRFYKLLSNINENLAGIRQEVERIGTNAP